MADINWKELDEKLNSDELAKAQKEYEKNGKGDYKEIPDDTYEVKVENMEMKMSKNGNPMLSIMFRITEGEFEKNCIFYNQVIKQGYPLHKAKEMLKSLDTGENITFESYSQFNDLIYDVFEGTDGLYYYLNYYEDKGYKRYEIIDVF